MMFETFPLSGPEPKPIPLGVDITTEDGDPLEPDDDITLLTEQDL
jgi:hypothetical protein